MTQAQKDALDAIFAQGQRKRGNPDTLDEGLALIQQAAHGGHGEAAHMVALLLAANPQVDDAWGYALAYLGRAAKAAHGLSQRTLALLAGDEETGKAIARGEIAEPQIWHRLHDAIDPARWLQTPEPRIVSAAPHIATIPGLLSAPLCDWIIERARPGLVRAQVYSGEEPGGSSLTDKRSNSTATFDLDGMDLAMLFVSQRIMQLTRAPFIALEPLSVMHYAPGQEFRRHFDFLDPAVPAFASEVAEKGQRRATLLVYLNDDYAGGETDFPTLKFRFKGRKGDGLLFHNVDGAGAPDRRTLHAGLTPAAGEKWLLSQWIRGPA